MKTNIWYSFPGNNALGLENRAQNRRKQLLGISKKTLPDKAAKKCSYNEKWLKIVPK